MQVMQHGWTTPSPFTASSVDPAKSLVAKFKNLSRVLRLWYSQLANLSKTIESNKLMLQFLDAMEEFWDLSLEEWNFRALVRDHLGKLLEQQKTYWKQRRNIKWATLGDENINFFHANATVRHNRNAVRVLKGDNGQEMFKHEDKANLICEYFKERLGTSEFNDMYYDLQNFIQLVDNLKNLVEPFSFKEIDNVTKKFQDWKISMSWWVQHWFHEKMLGSH
jgi:hypothetical protein